MNRTSGHGRKNNLWRRYLGGDDSTVAGRRVAKILLPWLPFLLILLWSWRSIDLFNEVPFGSDNFEVLWSLSWFGRISTSDPTDLLHYDLLFHPEGWRLVNIAIGPATFLPLLPLQWLAGPAFALNSGYLLMLFVTYAGTYKLARVLNGPIFAAILAALLYTFWGNRWFRLYGHTNVVLASAILPWMIWSLERAILSTHRKKWWILLTGLLWAFSIYASLYFIWLGGLAISGWMGVRLFNGDIDKRQTVLAAAAIIGSAFLLVSPFILFFWWGLQTSQSPSRTIYELIHWGASLNSLPLAAVDHPFLNKWSRFIYTGPNDESGVVRFGLIVVVLALITIPIIWRQRRWRPLLALTVVGTILALGPTLKWNGDSLQLPWLKPLNDFLWQIGHTLKPSVFPANQPAKFFLNAIPLPGIVPAIVIPFWESARVSARYAFVAGIGIFIAAAIGVSRIKTWWVRGLLALLLIIEVFPSQLQSIEYPPKDTHAAFEWLNENTLPEEGIVDVWPQVPNRLVLKTGGETLLATTYHQRATASGASSVWPSHSRFLKRWFEEASNPLGTNGFAEVMRFFGIRYIALHMVNRSGLTILEEVESHPELEEIGCFPAPEGPVIWSKPICLVEVLPSSFPQTNLILVDGWSGKESWGFWAEGESSHAEWIATAQLEHKLSLEAFPHCLEGNQQEISIAINEQELASHKWQGCEPWAASITIPANIVEIGENQIVLDYGYAVKPIDATDGQNSDPRPLSVGFLTLRIEKR